MKPNSLEYTIVLCCVVAFCVAILATAAHCQEPPKPPSKIKFWTLTAATAGVIALDGWQTSRPGREIGTPWLYGSHPCDHQVRLSLTLAGEVGGSALLGHFLQHRKGWARKVWAVPQSTLIGTHTRGVIHNFRVGLY